ncbi:hypothetical protein ACFLZD_01405, partial [Candidatus Neomarinimicrobiota bacterium]
MKKIYVLITIIVFYLFNIAIAQSTSRNVDKFGKKCKKGHTESCEQLNYIAQSDSDKGIRIRAVRYVTDQNILADIAKSDPEFQVRGFVVEKLTDQNVLVDIAKNEPVRYIR